MYRQLGVSERLRGLLPERDLRSVRSILFDKTPDENWPVPWHQDLTISVREREEVEGYGPSSEKDGVPHVQPPLALLEGMATIRIHLDDTPRDNGALAVVPRRQKAGKLDSKGVAAFSKSESVECDCEAGDVLLMSALILHSSKRSRVPSRRRVLHFEYARESDLSPCLNWFESE